MRDFAVSLPRRRADAFDAGMVHVRQPNACLPNRVQAVSSGADGIVAAQHGEKGGARWACSTERKD